MSTSPDRQARYRLIKWGIALAVCSALLVLGYITSDQWLGFMVNTGAQ